MKNLLLFVLVVLLAACSRKDSPAPTPVYPPTLKSYTKKMAGRRLWHGSTEFIYIRSGLPDTTIYTEVSDSGITIEVIDDSTIHIPWRDYSFRYHKTADSLDYIVFWGNSPTTIYNYCHLYYFYAKDSMTDTTHDATQETGYNTYLRTGN